MSSDNTQEQETKYKPDQRRLTELIKKLSFSKEQIEKRMKELKPDEA